MVKTYKIQIEGIVQGVGFRPFIFNLAKKHALEGTVSNNEKGVIVYINSSKEKVEQFLQELKENKPKTATIISCTLTEETHKDLNDFKIVPSKKGLQINLPLTPDFAICSSCKKEISDPQNRRFNYPFTTCVNCGPRYSITNLFPFERAHTSMSRFIMCEHCYLEYTNSKDKRFHSQTNSCNVCGITLRLLNRSNEEVADSQKEIIEKVSELLVGGSIIAVKNTNGYLLCCDASNLKAINALRERKKRPSKPFAVLYPSIEEVKKDFFLSSQEETMLLSTIRPIVILQKKKKVSSNSLTSYLNQTGVMLPSSALLALIMKKAAKPIVATSGNVHGSSIISEEKEATEHLKEVADYFLHHDLDIQFPQDDSVVTFADDGQIILRRSRGLSPNYIHLKLTEEEPILAMGAHLKSTFTFTPNTHTYVSQYFGNLDNYDVFCRYKTTIKRYVYDIFKTLPKKLLVDKHLHYQSTILGHEWGQQLGIDIIGIQHHKAHLMSVLGEYGLFDCEKKILGVIWDGTGLGDDSQIWGGEFFTYHNHSIDRLTHFEYFDWLANDKMAKEPRLSLFSLLDRENKESIKNKFSETEWNIYSQTITTNTLKTSSVGRMFDAVASLLNMADFNSFEGEAAMRLQYYAHNHNKKNHIDFLEHETYDKIPSKHIIRAITEAYKKGVEKENLAYSFMYTLAKVIIKIAKKNSINLVVCSGGVFQNSLLVSVLSRMADKNKIKLKINRKLSPNDENVSFGQLMYYQNIIKKQNHVLSNSRRNKKH